jgi:hypothetical protein
VTQADPLAGLRDHIRSATEAAERLVRDTRSGSAPAPPAPAPPPGTSRPDIPAAGWQQADDAGAPADLAALARLLELLREALPPELHQQVTDLIRQVLLVLGALIDWAVVRLEQDCRGREVAVEDIPIS